MQKSLELYMSVSFTLFPPDPFLSVIDQYLQIVSFKKNWRTLLGLICMIQAKACQWSFMVCEKHNPPGFLRTSVESLLLSEQEGMLCRLLGVSAAKWKQGVYNRQSFVHPSSGHLRECCMDLGGTWRGRHRKEWVDCCEYGELVFLLWT